MTEAIRKLLPPEYAAILALLSSIVTAVFSAGYQSAQLDAAEKDVARLERTIRYLELRLRRVEMRVPRDTTLIDKK